MYRIAAGSRNIPVLNITKLRVVSRHVVTKTCAWTVKNRAPKLIVTGFQIFVNKSDISEKSFLKFLFKIIKHWFIRIKICHRVNHFIFSNILKNNLWLHTRHRMKIQRKPIIRHLFDYFWVSFCDDFPL